MNNNTSSQHQVAVERRTGRERPTDLLDLLAEIDAPRRHCGHLIPMDNYVHAEQCLALTCPHCGTTVRNAYALVIEHGALDQDVVERFGTCWPQHWMFERVASCTTCHWPTFGIWPCRNKNCANGCHVSHQVHPCPTEVARHV